MNPEKENVCGECNKAFSCISNLNRHKKNVHTKKKDRNIKDVFVCSVCNKKCFDRKSFQNHWNYNHSSKSKTRKSSVCPICERDVQFPLLTDHFNQKHGIQIDEQEYVFQNEKSFLKWKKKTEEDTSSKFVLSYTQNQKEAKLKKYICHRSGTFVSKSKGKRHLKSQGSKKIGTFCPASIRVTDYGKKLSVKFTSTHIGHDCSSDLCHLNISPTKKEEIAKKFIEKVPNSCIIETICASCDGKVSVCNESDGASKDAVDNSSNDVIDTCDVNLDNEKEHIIMEICNCTPEEITTKDLKLTLLRVFRKVKKSSSSRGFLFKLMKIVERKIDLFLQPMPDLGFNVVYGDGV